MIASLRHTHLVILVLLACLGGCATPSNTGTESTSSEPEDDALFEVPKRWELLDERESPTLYQANLRNNEGAGRMLIGRLKLKEDQGELDSYLYRLHTQLVQRIQGQAALQPFAEERLAWANGIVGYRTKMRGELGNEVVILEGITFSDGKNAYFHYGLFADRNYRQDRLAYARVLNSLKPLRGAKRLQNRGLEIADSNEVVSKDVGSDGATSAQDYQSPETHLGLAAWGTTREKIRADSGPPLREGKNAVGYRCQLLSADDCVVIYLFEYDQLTHGGFLFEETFDDPRKHVARYLRMTKKLAQKFGRPKQSAAIWSDPTYRDKGSMWGEALANQHVIFGTVWEIGPTKVVHSLRKDDDGNIEHRLLMSNEKLRQSVQKVAAASN